MNHLKIIGYIASFIALFAVLFIAAPALISAKSTVAVITGFALIFVTVYLVGAYIYKIYQDHVKPNKENS